MREAILVYFLWVCFFAFVAFAVYAAYDVNKKPKAAPTNAASNAINAARNTLNAAIVVIFHR